MASPGAQSFPILSKDAREAARSILYLSCTKERITALFRDHLDLNLDEIRKGNFIPGTPENMVLEYALEGQSRNVDWSSGEFVARFLALLGEALRESKSRPSKVRTLLKAIEKSGFRWKKRRFESQVDLASRTAPEERFISQWARPIRKDLEKTLGAERMAQVELRVDRIEQIANPKPRVQLWLSARILDDKDLTSILDVLNRHDARLLVSVVQPNRITLLITRLIPAQ